VYNNYSQVKHDAIRAASEVLVAAELPPWELMQLHCRFSNIYGKKMLDNILYISKSLWPSLATEPFPSPAVGLK